MRELTLDEMSPEAREHYKRMLDADIAVKRAEELKLEIREKELSVGNRALRRKLARKQRRAK